MGWLGWDEERALRSDVNAIQVAYDGRCDLIGTVLKAVFGEGDPSSKTVSESSIRPMSGELFDALFSG